MKTFNKKYEYWNDIFKLRQAGFQNMGNDECNGCVYVII